MAVKTTTVAKLTEELNDHVGDVINAAKDVQGAYEWGTGIHAAERALQNERDAFAAWFVEVIQLAAAGWVSEN